MQAIADMLSVTITVLSSDYPAYSITSQANCSTDELFVGLIIVYNISMIACIISFHYFCMVSFLVA